MDMSNDILYAVESELLSLEALYSWDIDYELDTSIWELKSNNRKLNPDSPEFKSNEREIEDLETARRYAKVRIEITPPTISASLEGLEQISLTTYENILSRIQYKIEEDVKEIISNSPAAKDVIAENMSGYLHSVLGGGY